MIVWRRSAGDRWKLRERVGVGREAVPSSPVPHR